MPLFLIRMLNLHWLAGQQTVKAASDTRLPFTCVEMKKLLGGDVATKFWAAIGGPFVGECMPAASSRERSCSSRTGTLRGV